MGLSRERAEAALVGCMALSDFRRGALRGFLSALSDDELKDMRIDSESNDEIAGFLDWEATRSGDMISRLEIKLLNKVSFYLSLVGIICSTPSDRLCASLPCSHQPPHAYFILPLHAYPALFCALAFAISISIFSLGSP